jgi:hypothetical protein
LLASLLEGTAPNDGVAENELLGELFQGYPVQKLRLLLHTDRESAVVVGMWLASELGANARPLFADVISLIRYPNKKVRFWALDVCMTCSRPEDAASIRAVLGLVDDPESAVRWNAMIFLSNGPETVFRSLRDKYAGEAVSDAQKEGLSILVDAVTARNSAAISAALTHSDAIVRRYAAAAAARLAYRDDAPLRQAMSSSDPDVKDTMRA